MILPTMENDWLPLFEKEREKPYFAQLISFLEKEYEQYTIYPKREDIFTCLNTTPFHQVKVVIVGQDPYHGPNQAHGLSFSVQPGVKIPPSLKNMYKELQADIGCSIPQHGNLKSWATQGVLLLNTVLTVRAGEANSHRKKGWENFTDEVIQKLNNREKSVIFVLWGKPAQAKLSLIDQKKHSVIMSNHPSPLSAHRGFFGSKPYSTINKRLEEQGEVPIDWCITDFLEGKKA